MLSSKPEGSGGTVGLPVVGSAALSLLDGGGFLPRRLIWDIFRPVVQHLS